jgi:hypothetical protein
MLLILLRSLESLSYDVGFEVFTAVIKDNVAFYDVAPCGPC